MGGGGGGGGGGSGEVVLELRPTRSTSGYHDDELLHPGATQFCTFPAVLVTLLSMLISFVLSKVLVAPDPVTE